MTIEQELLDRAYARGEEAGRIEARVSGLETDRDKTAEALVELGTLINSTVTTVQLLASEIKARAESDKKLWEQRDKAVADTARAIKEEKDSAARAIKEDKDLTATTLSNAVNKANIKWVPRMGWVNYVMMVSAILGVSSAIYFGAVALSHSKTIVCVEVDNVGCVIK